MVLREAFLCGAGTEAACGGARGRRRLRAWMPGCADLWHTCGHLAAYQHPCAGMAWNRMAWEGCFTARHTLQGPLRPLGGRLGWAAVWSGAEPSTEPPALHCAQHSEVSALGRDGRGGGPRLPPSPCMHALWTKHQPLHLPGAQAPACSPGRVSATPNLSWRAPASPVPACVRAPRTHAVYVFIRG